MNDKVLGTAIILVQKVTNTIDGGGRVTLDFSANDAETIKKLFQAALDQEQLFVTFVKKDG